MSGDAGRVREREELARGIEEFRRFRAWAEEYAAEHPGLFTAQAIENTPIVAHAFAAGHAAGDAAGYARAVRSILPALGWELVEGYGYHLADGHDHGYGAACECDSWGKRGLDAALAQDADALTPGGAAQEEGSDG